MGLLDDAIREHLELKRRHGADPDEVARQENEALGATRRAEFARPEGGEPAETPEASAVAETGEAAPAGESPAEAEPFSGAVPEFAPGEAREVSPAADEPFSGAPPEFPPASRTPEPSSEAAAPEAAAPAPSPPAPPPDTAEQPLAAPEPSPPEPVVEAGDEREPFDVDAERATPSTDPWLEDERDEVPAGETLEHPRGEPDEEDVLEETPDFLQETPEHDRLWFEQRPPRPFDFDE